MLTILETTLFYILRTFSSTLEMLLAFLMMNAFFDDRFKHKHPKRIMFVTGAAILLALQETGSGGNIKTAFEILFIFATALTVYSGEIKIKLVYGALFSICLALSELMAGFTFRQFIDKIPIIDSESFFYRILSIELSNLFMLVFILLLSMFTKSKNKKIAFRYWLLLMIVPLTTLGTLTVYQFYIEQLTPGEEINAYIIISTIGLVFINILVFTLFSKLQNQLEIRRSSDLLEMQMHLEKASFSRLEDSYNKTRELRHDLKNHILSLKGIASNGTREELLAYLDRMTDSIEESTYISISKNSAVDAVLNEKLFYAQRAGIATQFDITPLDGTSFAPMDICTIISNALDNAIEACEKLGEESEKYIELKISDIGDEMIISVKNPVAGALQKNANGLFNTDKPDKESHGLGLKSIKSTAKKYGGEMLTKIDNGTFNLIVRLINKK